MALKLRDPMLDLAAFGKGQFECVWLRIPRELVAIATVRVVLGGLASQQHVPLDRLDDLQLAVEMIIKEELRVEGDELVLLARAEQGKVCVRLDGLTNSSLREALLYKGKPRADHISPLPLDMSLVLSSLVEGYEVLDSGECFAVQMTKHTR